MRAALRVAFRVVCGVRLRTWLCAACEVVLRSVCLLVPVVLFVLLPAMTRACALPEV